MLNCVLGENVDEREDTWFIVSIPLMNAVANCARWHPRIVVKENIQ